MEEDTLEGSPSLFMAHIGDRQDGELVVIDLGCSSAFSPLEWLSGQSKTIDNLIITHPHGDHIDEFLLIKKMGFKVRQLWRPRWLERKVVYEQNQSTYTEKLDAYFEMSDRYTGKIADNELVGNPAVSGGGTLFLPCMPRLPSACAKCHNSQSVYWSGT